MRNRDNFCTDKDSHFNYATIRNEVGTTTVLTLSFDAYSMALSGGSESIDRVSDDGCFSLWRTYRMLLTIVLLGLLLFLLFLLARFLYVRSSRRRVFMPLPTSEKPRRKADATDGSFVFSLNTYDRVQKQL